MVRIVWGKLDFVAVLALSQSFSTGGDLSAVLDGLALTLLLLPQASKRIQKELQVC